MQLDLGFVSCATPGSVAGRPDENWLFAKAGVRELCGRRQCVVLFKSDLAAEVEGSVHRRAAANPHAPQRPAPITLTAIQPGRWHPVHILAACTKANCGTPYDVDPEKAQVINRPIGDDRLDEIKIARVVGADGVRPYLSRKSFVEDRYVNAGYPTRSFRCLFDQRSNKTDYRVRRALRALEDVGLVDIEPGPRGGLATATVTWTPRAMLPPQLSLSDHEAIAEIAAWRI